MSKKNATKRKKSVSKPELLAPAGSLESFHAAVDGGADAIYIGLKDFNARIRAKNISAKTLSFMTPYAHRKNVRIYVTLNTLAKRVDLPPLLDTLHQLRQIGVDAVIVQDLGTVYLARTHFPELALHASTQMVFHNAESLKTAEKLGFERVILPRELTLQEIHTIADSTRLGIEVFVHGAICYSISGLCLASSFLGGMSGNRGRCTQVCRRAYSVSGNKKSFVFSPGDFQAAEYLGELKKAGVSSLKIEGRMKSAEYVHTVVSAYRGLLDGALSDEEAGELLGLDMGRSKTSFFLNGTTNNDLITPERPQGTGVYLGPVRRRSDALIELSCDHSPASGDRIRFHDARGEEGDTAVVESVETHGASKRLRIRENITIPRGSHAFLIRKKSAGNWGKRKIDGAPVPFSERCPGTSRLLKSSLGKTTRPNGGESEHRVYLRVDKSGWLKMNSNRPVSGWILDFSPGELLEIAQEMNQPEATSLANTWISLPPFIPQEALSQWKEVITTLGRAGFRKWVCNHVGQRTLFRHNEQLLAGDTVWCLNPAAATQLEKLGFTGFMYSAEDDILNIKACGSPKGFFTLFSYVPGFISRIAPALELETPFTDSRGAQFFCKKRGELYYTINERPLSLTHRRDLLSTTGIRNFILDLRFSLPHKKTLQTVLDAYYEKKKMPESTLFNHKAGLK